MRPPLTCMRPSSAQRRSVGKTLPGLRRWFGSKAHLTRCCCSRSASVNMVSHEVPLLNPHPVLARQNSAQSDAQPQDVGPERLRLPDLPRLVRVVQDERMEIAVSGMEHVGDAQAVPGGEVRDAAQRLGETAPRNRPVHAHVVRADGADGGERVLAARPEPQTLGLAPRDGDRIRTRGPGDFRDPADERIHLAGRAVQFADHQRSGVARIAAGLEVLRGDDGRVVHHLHAARNDARGDDVGDAIRARLDAREREQQAAGRLGFGQQTDRDLGDHAQQALGTRHQTHEVVALGIEVLAAEPDQRAVHQHDLKTEDVVGGQAVLEAMDPAGVLADIAPDRAGDLG